MQMELTQLSRKSIINRITEAINLQGLEAVICISPENFAYVSGFVVPSQPLMRWRHAAVVVTANGDSSYLAVDMEKTTVEQRINNAELYIWGEFTDNPMSVLAEMLVKGGLQEASIGIEMDYLSADHFFELKELLPKANFQSAQNLLKRLRQIKTDQEIDLMRNLSRIADESIYSAISSVNAGNTEMDIAGSLTKNVYKLGADDFKLMIVATGPRSVLPNVGPTMRQLETRDICRVEIFSMINGYHAGVCRTAYVGTPPRYSEDIWQNLVECKYLVMDMIKPGASSKAIYEAFVDQLGKLNLPPIKFVGHGIGLHLHEEPYLGTYSDVQLEAGMVLGIEPLVYDTGHGYGMQNKDIVLVTETGVEILSDYTGTDKLIKVGQE